MAGLLEVRPGDFWPMKMGVEGQKFSGRSSLHRGAPELDESGPRATPKDVRL